MSGPRSRTRLSWLSPVVVVLAAVVWNAGAALLPAPPLGQDADLFGYGFLTYLLTLLVGAPLLVLVTLAALVAWVAPAVARATYGVSAALCTLVSCALVVLAVVLVVEGTDAGGTVFSALTVGVALVLMVPAWMAPDVVGAPGEGPG